MGPDGDYQPLLPNGNGKQLSHSSPLYAADFLESDNDKFDLGQLLAVARRRMIVIAGVAIAVTSGVVAKVLKEVPSYEGKFQLLVGDASSQENKFKQLSESLDKSAGGSVKDVDYETQIQVLWSPQVRSP